MSASRPIAVSGFGDDTEDEDDEAENSVGAKRVLARLGVAMARSNRNDEAALALRQAVLMKLPAGAEEDAALDFEARENLGMVVNRLFQPLDAYMAFAHGALLGALQRAIKGAVPQYVLDVGGGATGGLAAMLAAQAGAERVIVYESFKVRAAVVRDVLAANGVSDRVKVAELDLLDQPRPTPMQRDQPADTLMLDVAAHFGTDLVTRAPSLGARRTRARALETEGGALTCEGCLRRRAVELCSHSHGDARARRGLPCGGRDGNPRAPASGGLSG